MLGNNRYLAVIPARGGSTRLPRKNILPLLGKPLIAWTIEAAKNSKLLDRILVSTDDEKIKEVALEYEVEVHHRPRELASDRSLIVDTLYFISKENPGFNIVLMNPTSPIRSKGLVDKCIIEFDKNNYDTLASGIIIKLVPWPHSQIRIQDTEGFFIDNGAVYVFKESLIQKKKLVSDNYGKILVEKEESVDIDDEFDFKIAEFVLRNRLKKGFN